MPTHLTNANIGPTGLLADLYQLTMAYGFWKKERSETLAVFHLFFRQAPFQNRFALASGLELVVDFLNRWQFPIDSIAYLGRLRGQDGQPLFSVPFLNYLQRLRFSGNLLAVPEGTAVFPHQPLLRIEAPLAQGILIESALLNLINFSTLITTKANRMVRAAGGDPVLEFGLRRAQGIDGALTASRSAYLGGCSATSNLSAGFWYNIPATGTHAHAWVMCFDSEKEAFAAYAEALPNNCIFLVDTYDTLTGVDHAIAIGTQLRDRGYTLHGIRLDSGNLVALSQAARKKLDQAGFPEARIVASDNLDEHKIRSLKEAGAAIDTWGVGTRLVTGKDDPALGGIYKLGAILQKDNTWTSVLKRSDTPIKTSHPGILDVRRYSDPDGFPLADMLFDTLSNTRGEWVDMEGNNRTAYYDAPFDHLLTPIFLNGHLVYDLPSLPTIRERALQQALFFTERPYPYGMDQTLFQQKQRLSTAYSKA